MVCVNFACMHLVSMRSFLLIVLVGLQGCRKITDTEPASSKDLSPPVEGHPVSDPGSNSSGSTGPAPLSPSGGSGSAPSTSGVSPVPGSKPISIKPHVTVPSGPAKYGSIKNGSSGISYSLLSVLGSGAQGKVFLARPDSGPHALVAIKEAVIRKKSTDEINAMKAVKGIRGIIQIYDDFIANGKQYVVMELVGKSISTVRKTRGDLSVATVGSIGIQLIDRLEALHKAGYVHLDLNNGNIALDENGQLVLIDLGQALKWTQPGSRSRREEIGKFSFMIVNLLNRSVKSLSDPNACKGMPAPVTELVKYASSSFDAPDYNKIRTLMQQLVPQYTGSLIF